MNLALLLFVELPALKLYKVVLPDAAMPLVVCAPMWVTYAIESAQEEKEATVPPEACGVNWVPVAAVADLLGVILISKECGSAKWHFPFTCLPFPPYSILTGCTFPSHMLSLTLLVCVNAC